MYYINPLAKGQTEIRSGEKNKLFPHLIDGKDFYIEKRGKDFYIETFLNDEALVTAITTAEANKSYIVRYDEQPKQATKIIQTSLLDDSSSFKEDKITEILKQGSHVQDCKYRIYKAYFYGNEDFPTFLKNEYGWGGHGFSGENVNFSPKGMHIEISGREEQTENFEILLKWDDVSKRLGRIIERGEFLTPQEELRLEEQIKNEQQEEISSKDEVDTTKVTPYYKQYLDVEKKYEGCIVAMQLGDFYEIMGKNAISVADKLDLTLTGRDVGLQERIPMCGFPYHVADKYLDILHKEYDIVRVNSGEAPIFISSLKNISKQISQESNTPLKEMDDFFEVNREKPKTQEEIIAEARERAKEIVKSSGQPMVIINWSESRKYKTGEVIHFAEAEKRLKEHNEKAMKEEDGSYFKTRLDIFYLDNNGETAAYNGCRYDIGSENGGLLQHIKENLEYLHKHPNDYWSISEDEYQKAQEMLEIFNLSLEKVKGIEESRNVAQQLGMPFLDTTYDESEFNPNVYDGRMNIEDYKKASAEALKEETMKKEETIEFKTAQLQVIDACRTTINEVMDYFAAIFTDALSDDFFEESSNLSKFVKQYPILPNNEKVKQYLPELIEEYATRFYKLPLDNYGWSEDSVVQTITDNLPNEDLREYAVNYLKNQQFVSTVNEYLGQIDWLDGKKDNFSNDEVVKIINELKVKFDYSEYISAGKYLQPGEEASNDEAYNRANDIGYEVFVNEKLKPYLESLTAQEQKPISLLSLSQFDTKLYYKLDKNVDINEIIDVIHSDKVATMFVKINEFANENGSAVDMSKYAELEQNSAMQAMDINFDNGRIELHSSSIKEEQRNKNNTVTKVYTIDGVDIIAASNRVKAIENNFRNQRLSDYIEAMKTDKKLNDFINQGGTKSGVFDITQPGIADFVEQYSKYIFKGDIYLRDENNSLVHLFETQINNKEKKNMNNSLILQGKIAKKAEVKISENATQYTNVQIVTEHSYDDKVIAQNINVTMFGDVAEAISKYNTGDCVEIKGRVTNQKKDNRMTLGVIGYAVDKSNEGSKNISKISGFINNKKLELKMGESGTKYTTVALSVKNESEAAKSPYDTFFINSFGKSAERICREYKQHDLIELTGSIQTAEDGRMSIVAHRSELIRSADSVVGKTTDKQVQTKSADPEENGNN